MGCRIVSDISDLLKVLVQLKRYERLSHLSQHALPVIGHRVRAFDARQERVAALAHVQLELAYLRIGPRHSKDTLCVHVGLLRPQIPGKQPEDQRCIVWPVAISLLELVEVLAENII